MWGREGELGSLGRDDVGESKDGFISSVPSHSRALTRAFIRNQCVNECYPIDARGNARLGNSRSIGWSLSNSVRSNCMSGHETRDILFMDRPAQT